MSGPRTAKAKAERGPWAYIGPGIVSGASDNDPTTVATLAVVGSTTVYGLSWLVVLIVPMLAIVQAISAQVGAISKAGLEDCIKRSYGRGWALVALVSVLGVNILTLAADLEGGASALDLLTGIHYVWYIAPLAAGTAILLVYGNQQITERFLKVIPLVFFAYAFAAVAAHPDWGAIARATFVPHFEFTSPYVSGAIALLGTTLTSYAYVWETIEVAQERPPLRRIGLVQADAALGTVVAGIAFWFIVVATGATLGVHHKTVETAQDAAQALAPIAGKWSSVLFGVGLLGSALLAVPVLAGTSAYVMAEMFGWRRSLDSSFARAPQFYRAMLASLAISTAIAFAGISPIALLYVSSIVAGIATPITLILMLLVARNRLVMRQHRLSTWLMTAGWGVAAIVVAATVAYFYQTVTGGGS